MMHQTYSCVEDSKPQIVLGLRDISTSTFNPVHRIEIRQVVRLKLHKAFLSVAEDTGLEPARLVTALSAFQADPFPFGYLPIIFPYGTRAAGLEPAFHSGCSPRYAPTGLDTGIVPKYGGANEIRTRNLLRAKQMLTQLSYGPKINMLYLTTYWRNRRELNPPHLIDN